MNKQALVAHLEIEIEELEIWLAQEWLVPAKSGEDVRFSDADAARGRLILDLKGGFGVNDPGIDVILHLIDQLHGFRRAFEGLHTDFQRSPR